MALCEPSLPRPLDDPLRSCRKWLPWLFALPFVLEIVLVFWSESSPAQRREGSIWLGVALGVVLQLPFIGLILHILPRRAVNAFYLRSFRHDPRSWPVRKAIQAALGRKYRLSGIRDPRRRMPVVRRFLAFAVFLFRYSTPKYMNLEAGRDWQTRLGRSLGDARCAFIDLSDLTPFVEEEIHLCLHCLGPERVLFIGDPSRSVAEWQALVVRILSLDDSARDAIPVVRWEDSREGRKAFHDAVTSFASRLPRGTAGVKSDGAVSPQVAVMPVEEVRAEVRGSWAQMVLGLALAVLVMAVYAYYVPRQGWSQVLWVAPFAMAGYVLFLTIGYLVDCGSARERVVVGAWLTVVVAAIAVPFLPVIYRAQKVREAAYRAYTRNNLRQIGMAMQEYVATFHRLPGHAIYHEGKPILSWRVALLPFLGEEELYRQFRLDEPWDSPHNQVLLKLMPKVYAPADGQGAAPYSTVYQVFVSRPGAPPRRQAVFEDRPGPGRRPIEIADPDTILVVEARKAVSWTKPEDLPFDDLDTSGGGPAQLSDRVGRRSYPYFHALFCDGSAHAIYRTDLSGKSPEETLRALITPAGGEDVVPFDVDPP